MQLNKKQSRRRWSELRDLVSGWDPLGLIEMGAPLDEYDCLLGPLMRHLEQGAPEAVISSYLEHEFSEHFGMGALPERDSIQLAHQARAWFSKQWADSMV